MKTSLTLNEFIRESKGSKIIKLAPDTVISVYHGTQLSTARDFCINGIDATAKIGPADTEKESDSPLRRKHTHEYDNPMEGVFISPDLQTASKFGPAIIKFKTQGKNLFDPNPETSPDFDPDPNSFRPEVTYELLGQRSKYDPRGLNERQARFIGKLNPQAIECVYWIDRNTRSYFKPLKFKKLSREEFIELTKSGKPFKAPIFDTQHPKTSVYNNGEE